MSISQHQIDLAYADMMETHGCVKEWRAREEVLLRMPGELKDWIDKEAEERDWSRNLFLCEVLKAVKREKNLEMGFNT